MTEGFGGRWLLRVPKARPSTIPRLKPLGMRIGEDGPCQRVLRRTRRFTLFVRATNVTKGPYVVQLTWGDLLGKGGPPPLLPRPESMAQIVDAALGHIPS